MIYRKSGQFFFVGHRVLRNRGRIGSGHRVHRRTRSTSPGKVYSLFGASGAVWPTPSGALGEKHPGHSETQRTEIYVVRRDLSGVFLSRLRQKAHSASRIQEEISGNAKAGAANRRNSHERVRSPAWGLNMNFRTHKERLLKNPKVKKAYEKLGPEFQLAQSLIRARMKKGWTQAELARRVGMQQPNIARLEGGNYDRVSLPTLKKVARALGADIEIKLSA